MNGTSQGSLTSTPIQPRFFAALPLDEQLKSIVTKNSNRPSLSKRKSEMVRYAGYIRISSEEQVGNYSVEAQNRAITTWVHTQGGQLVQVYIDEAQSGRTIERPAFQQMRQDARMHKFDAVVVHKFDRFARNRTDALAIKSLLRYDYNIKVYSVTEPSEDSDGPIGALIEGIMESVAEWYSRNLASEVAKGRREKGTQGYHNNLAPFGLKREGKTLVADENELPGLIMAFKAYATGNCSTADIARLLNENGYKSKSGRPFSKDTVRDILRNQIYLGKVCYQETRRNSDGKRNFSAPVEWFDGQHEAVIDIELFEQCQQVHIKRGFHRQSNAKYNPYVLRGLVYCHKCCTNPPSGADFPSWGKMFCQKQQGSGNSYYRCKGRAMGFQCSQGGVRTETVESQVFAILSELKPSPDWRKRIVGTISDILNEKNLEERLNEIRTTIERMDFRWDNGFITDKVDYLEKRLKLQQELERLTPVEDELDTAVDLLENFTTHWNNCKGDIELQHQLIQLIADRVYVEDDKVVAMTLKSDYHVVLGHNANEPTTLEFDPHIHVWAQRDLNP